MCHVQTVPDHIEKRIDGLIRDVPIEGVGKAVHGFSWEGDRVRVGACLVCFVDVV
jgi:hypothetical protein